MHCLKGYCIMYSPSGSLVLLLPGSSLPPIWPMHAVQLYCSSFSSLLCIAMVSRLSTPEGWRYGGHVMQRTSRDTSFGRPAGNLVQKCKRCYAEDRRFKMRMGAREGWKYGLELAAAPQGVVFHLHRLSGGHVGWRMWNRVQLQIFLRLFVPFELKTSVFFLMCLRLLIKFPYVFHYFVFVLWKWLYCLRFY
jgi:hypothetical protein